MQTNEQNANYLLILPHLLPPQQRLQRHRLEPEHLLYIKPSPRRRRQHHPFSPPLRHPPSHLKRPSRCFVRLHTILCAYICVRRIYTFAMATMATMALQHTTAGYAELCRLLQWTQGLLMDSPEQQNIMLQVKPSAQVHDLVFTLFSFYQSNMTNPI